MNDSRLAALGAALNTLIDAHTAMARTREADKQVIEQLGATVEILDARLLMLSAKVDDLEAKLGG